MQNPRKIKKDNFWPSNCIQSFIYVVLSCKHKYKETFAIVCFLIVKKLCVTKSSIPLMNKVDSTYIAISWFRLTLVDLAFRVLLPHFRTVFDWIKTNLLILSPLELINKCNHAKVIESCVCGHIKETSTILLDFDKCYHRSVEIKLHSK